MTMKRNLDKNAESSQIEESTTTSAGRRILAGAEVPTILSVNDGKKTSEIENFSVVKRRSFLKKSATGAVLVSLPAQSVWGACSVSGSMSGNLSQNTGRHDCPVPSLAPGKIRAWWQNVYENNNNNNPIDGFTSISGDTQRECYRVEIQDVMDNNNMALATELFPSPQTTLYTSLANGTPLERKLAAVFLNSYFGFYGALDERDITKANERVNDILLYVILQENQGNPIATDQLNALLNLTGQSVTDYTAANCV
jgi:hypothetical protein